MELFPVAVIECDCFWLTSVDSALCSKSLKCATRSWRSLPAKESEVRVILLLRGNAGEKERKEERKQGERELMRRMKKGGRDLLGNL